MTSAAPDDLAVRAPRTLEGEDVAIETVESSVDVADGAKEHVGSPSQARCVAPLLSTNPKPYPDGRDDRAIG